MIVVDDGRLLTGLVVEETDDQLRLLPNLLKPDKIETIDKSSIEERKTLPKSRPCQPVCWILTRSKKYSTLLAYIQSVGPAKGSTAPK